MIIDAEKSRDPLREKEKVIYKKGKGHERIWIGPVAHLEEFNQSALVHIFIFNTTAILGG